MSGFFNLGRRRDDVIEHQDAPVTPATVAAAELRRIDTELTTLAQQDRTDNVLAAIDHWLDRRIKLARRDVPVIPGRSS